MAQALKKARSHAQTYHAVSKNHGTMNRDIGKKGDKPTAAIYKFLEKLWAPVKSQSEKKESTPVVKPAY